MPSAVFRTVALLASPVSVLGLVTVEYEYPVVSKVTSAFVSNELSNVLSCPY